MLKLTILGCGTSSGVPRIGNQWGACDPAEPRNHRRRASILVETDSTHILVDTGPDMREQLIAADVSALDAVLWTHDHADHCHGIDDLRQVAQIARAPVRAFAHAAVLDSLSTRFAYAFTGSEFYPPVIDAAPLPSGPFTVGNIRVAWVDQPHGDIRSTGFLFSHNGVSIGYSTDCHEITPEMIATFAGADIWVVDALRRRAHPTHASLGVALGGIAAARPKRAILTHMDTSMDYRDLSASLPDGVEPGYDGMIVRLAAAALA